MKHFFAQLLLKAKISNDHKFGLDSKCDSLNEPCSSEMLWNGSFLMVLDLNLVILKLIDLNDFSELFPALNCCFRVFS